MYRYDCRISRVRTIIELLLAAFALSGFRVYSRDMLIIPRVYYM